MRKLLLTTAAVAICSAVCSKTPTPESVPKTRGTVSLAFDAPVIIYDTLIDERDGKMYKTVKMPDNNMWMAENIDYKPQKGKSWCYENKSANCGKYGRLYDWNTAWAVCPSGWRLPSRHDWKVLEKALDSARIARYGMSLWDSFGISMVSMRLKAKIGWYDQFRNDAGNGNDNHGFSALPGGCRCNGFRDAGFNGYWWESTEHSHYTAYGTVMSGSYNSIGWGYESNKNNGYSVRCVADPP
jgi:uncharacterized protein (TIGR02145 family)